MTDAFVGEIRIVGFNFAPRNWALCDGQLLAVAQNSSLFSLIGTFYGGDGRSTFALPDLQGSLPVGTGQGDQLSAYAVGQTGGAASVALTESQIPAHRHTVSAAERLGSNNAPAGGLWAQPRYGRVGEMAYTLASPDVQLNPAAFAGGGGNQPHNNLPPYLALNFIICLAGVFPPRS
jgi:microcystin-dependent protein